MKQTAGQKILSMILAVAIVLSVGVMPVYAVEGGALSATIPQENSTVVESETCSSCGKAAHEGACETTENTEPEVAISITEDEKECTCPTVDSGEVTHTEGCPLYITPAYQCPLCKDERLDEHVDGVCPLNLPLTRMQLFSVETTVTTEEQLHTAIADAPTDGTATTIKLGESFSVDQTVTITDANIILDLNGFTLSSTSVSTIMVFSAGSLEIIDTSEGAAGVVSASGERPVSGEPFYTIDSNGTVKISSGMVTAKDKGWSAINNRGGTVTVTGGTVSTNSNLYAITNNYTSNGVVNISGGTVSAPAFSIDNQGTVNITGGTVTVSENGYTITNSYTGIVNVSDGEVTAPSSGGLAIRSHNGGKVNVTGGTVTAGSIAIYSATEGEEINISGGTIGTVDVKDLNLSGAPTLTVSLYDMQNKKISITGELTGADGGIMLDAQYGVNPAHTVVATATAPEHAVVEKFALINSMGKSLVKNDANIEIVQAPSLITSEAELNTAITNAASTGTTTIKLGNNFSISTSANITDKNIILDLNGFTLSSTTNTLFLNGTASLEVKDTSTGENGVVSSSGGNTIFNNGSGTVKVSSGKVFATGDGKRAILNNDSGTVNVTGGTVTATGNGSYVYAIYNVTWNGTVNISGGTIGKVSSAAINLSGNPTLTVNLYDMENNQISITGELTGADGGIALDAQYGVNPALTVVATATAPEHAVVEKFALVNSVGKCLIKNGANIEITQTNPTVWDGTLPTANPAYTFSGGDGSESAPYQVDNSYDLAMLSANVSAGTNYSGTFFEQTADIDLNPGITVSASSTTAKAWMPIGINVNIPFQGAFNGAGHIVKGIYINRSDLYNQGLFGATSSPAVIKNVGVEESYIYGATHVGGVVGSLIGGTIESCYNKSTIQGTSYVGGVVGSGIGSTLKNCYNTGTVTGTAVGTGGVAGTVASSGMISNCYNTGAVTGTARTGGVVGNLQTGGKIANCVSLGSAITGGTATNRVAGFGASGAIASCYARSNMLVNGGIVTFGTSSNENGEDISTPQSWATWFKNGTDAWVYPTGSALNSWDELPELKVISMGPSDPENPTDWDGTLPTANPAYTFSGGDGSESAPYQVDNSYDLAMLSANVNDMDNYSKDKFFLMTDDIVLNDSLDGTPKAWKPIGKRTYVIDTHDIKNAFQGSFNGGGHTVKGVYITGSSAYQGLFGLICNAVVSNLGVVDSTIHGDNYVGSIVGLVQNSTVEKCYNTSSVSATYNAGGIAGAVDGTSTLKNCYNTADVIATAHAAGGITAGNDGLLQNCYNTGKITTLYGNNGGIVAIHGGTLSNCVSLGSALSSGTSINRVVGAEFSSTITNNYARSDMQVNGATVTSGTSSNENGADLTVSDSTAQAWSTWFSDSSAWDYPAEKLVIGAALPTLKGFAGSVAQNPTLPEAEKAPAPTAWNGVIPTANPGYSYGGGNGTAGNPYKIANGEQLAMLAANVNNDGEYSKNKFFEQTADIVLNDSLDGTPKAWNAIGLDSAPFKGTFNGGGHTVKGVFINKSSYNQGLFGYISGANVKNLGVIESAVTGSYNVGGVVGMSATSTVENCFNTGEVSGDGNVGGVVGNAWQTGTVSGESLVQNCYNTGSIRAYIMVGGVVGTSSNITTVQNCYNIGHVTGSGIEVGGVVGRTTGSSGEGSSVISNVKNCVSLGQTVTTGISNSYVARVVGRVLDNVNIINCYARSDLKIVMSGNAATVTGGAVNNKNGADLTVSASTVQDWSTWFSDNSAWDMTEIGNLVAGAKLPVLAGFSAEQTPTLPEASAGPNPTDWASTNPTADPSYTYSGGDGTDASPYLIANSYDLAMLAANTNAISSYSSGKYFKQTADIVLNSTISSSAKQWTPIGSHDNRFSSTYDGSGYTISGLYIYDKNITTGQAKALFGYARNASIKNVGIINSEITGAADVGSLVAISVKSIVENCYNTGNVTGELYIGGLIAQNEGVIKNCYNTGNVTAATRSSGGCVGGVVGLNHIDSEVTNCVYLGTSIIGYNAGRIANPFDSDKMGAFNNCYARNDMTINGSTVSGGTVTNANGKDLLVSSSTTQDWNTWFKGSTAWNYPTAKLIIGAILPTLKGTSSAQAPTLPGGGPAGPIITINTQPQDVSVMLGQTASFTVAATMSPTGTLTYQWYKSTSNSTAGGALIFGATSTSYTPPATTVAGAVYYYCVVSGGGVQAVSNIACMTVRTPTMNISGVVYDTNGTSPVSGAKVKLTPAAGSTEQTTGADGKYSFLNIPIGSYTITVTFPDGTEASIVVTNTNGGDVHVDDIPKPEPQITITTQPQNVSILQNKAASFTTAASVTNGAGVTYQWHSNSTNSTTGGALISGATSATYTPATATVGTTYYYCVVSSIDAASVTSKIASLTVRKTNTIAGTVADKDGNGIKDATVKLIPEAGTPNPATTDSDGKYTFSDVPDGNYTIIVTLPDGGIIKKDIAVPGDAGKDIEIKQPATPVITITTQPNNATVLKNKAASFTVEAGASNGAAITYQWYSNSKSDTTGASLISGATQASYTPATTAAGTNYYYCVISSKDMTSVTSRIARLTVRNTSTIDGIIKDKDGNPVKDADVKLTPEAGTPNPATTDSSGKYRLEDVPDGEYTITVTLPDGSTITKEIIVPDNNSPGGPGGNIQQPTSPIIKIAKQPSDVTKALNDTATFTVTAGVSSGTLVYQWYKNTSNSTTGGTLISGANAASYSPSTASKGESYYYCVLNATGAAPVTTGVAKLTVRNTMTGTTITGTVKDKADNPVQGATVTITDKTNPSNKHTTTTDADGNYTFTGVPDGDYMIIVTMPDGGTISGGIIAVKDGTPTNSVEVKQPANQTVTITEQPQDISVVVGTAARFAVSAGASSGTVAYQWYYSQTHSTTNGTKLKDATAAAYIPETTKSGVGYYYCVVSAGDASDVSNVAKLTVTTASASSGTIEGNVTDGTTHALLTGVELKVMKGGTNGTQFGATIITDADGKFSFIAIPYGSYSLVATMDGQTVTKQINIKSSRVVENMVMISGNKDTKVEIMGNTPSVAAENLTDMFTEEDDRISAEPSAKVEIMLVVEQLENIPEAEDDLINAILLEIKNGTVGLYLDAKLLKTITGMGIENVSNEAIQPPEGQKVRIVLDLPEHMRGRSGYLVLRVHEGKTLIIRPVYDSTLHTLTFDADKFSTYAITYSSEDVTKGGSSGRGNSSSTDAYNFWESVESKIMTVAQGDIVKVNAKSYDKMPVSVMDALSSKGVTLIISWNGGEDIYIPAGAAQKSEVNRIYYPLSLLAQLYKDAKISEIVQVIQGGNPETGGVGYTHDDYGKLIPIAGGIWELEASNVAQNEGKLNAITPSNGGFEKDVFMPDSDGTNTAQNSSNAARVTGLAALLATIVCGVLVLQKKRAKGKE